MYLYRPATKSLNQDRKCILSDNQESGIEIGNIPIHTNDSLENWF
jgi:hypothetical protein